MDRSINKGKMMYQWAVDLFPICRSITGEGVRETLAYLKDEVDELKLRSVNSGYKAFDWEVPDEWIIRDAYVKNKNGEKVIDFKKNNLHLVSYSEPIDKIVSYEELTKHLHSIPDMPDAIPYVTSYYSRNWGFCLTHNDRLNLKDEEYQVFIDSELSPGSMNYGEIVIPGNSKKEILLSTYICHPSMANNELSGPVVTLALSKYLLNQSNKYTYRIIFIPETIGSIVYLSKHLEHLQNKVIAGFNISCVGDDRSYSYLPSRTGVTLADRAAVYALDHIGEFKKYSFLERGSDERQYCSPLVDLPICSIMRSKFGSYPEYHTSLDNLQLISPEGLEGTYNVLIRAFDFIESSSIYKAVYPCEPQLGKRGLYPKIGAKKHPYEIKDMMDLLAYCDGKNDLAIISEMLGKELGYLKKIAENLLSKNLIEEI